MRSGSGIVFFARFGDCDYQRRLPSGMMESEFYGSFEEVGEDVLESVV